ncbi:MAG: glutamate--cysteine ligase [Magnetococcus sp. DMHC-6]
MSLKRCQRQPLHIENGIHLRMSTLLSNRNEVITQTSELYQFMATGCKPRKRWRVGTEHEKFGFRKKDYTPIPYDGPDGIRALLEAMAQQFEWQIVYENNHPIALRQGAASITLEPGGQLELSGAPLRTIHETQQEINDHLSQLGRICREMDMAFLGAGVQPKWPMALIPWMPKERYRIMGEYLPTRGSLSLEMMTRTATVQANLDFSSEADMARKFRLSMALQPLVVALFANSPFCDGQPNGFLSYRSHIWHHTDPDRCGWLPFLFEGEFTFERYVDYALDVPMFFVYRQGAYLPAHGVPFRAFLAGRLPILPGEYPTIADWELHLSTLFPDVRLKTYLELRGADAGNSASLSALPALWKGLLYHKETLEAAWELVRHWTPEEREAIHRTVPKMALHTPLPNGKTMQHLAKTILQLAKSSLEHQDCRNHKGCNESIFLKPLELIANTGITPAEKLLHAFHGHWNHTIDPIFTEQEFESFYAEC